MTLRAALDEASLYDQAVVWLQTHPQFAIGGLCLTVIVGLPLLLGQGPRYFLALLLTHRLGPAAMPAFMYPDEDDTRGDEDWVDDAETALVEAVSRRDSPSHPLALDDVGEPPRFGLYDR
jgi:hypothetical protein